MTLTVSPASHRQRWNLFFVMWLPIPPQDIWAVGKHTPIPVNDRVSASA